MNGDAIESQLVQIHKQLTTINEWIAGDGNGRKGFRMELRLAQRDIDELKLVTKELKQALEDDKKDRRASVGFWLSVCTAVFVGLGGLAQAGMYWVMRGGS